jgi:hypothetical protein
MDYGMDDQGFFFSPQRPDWLFDPPSFPYEERQRPFPLGLSSRCLKLIIYLDLEPKLRMPVSLPPLPLTFSRCDAYIITGATLPHLYSFDYYTWTYSDVIFFNLLCGGWSPNWVHSARRPLTGLLYLPRVIVRMVNLVEWRLAGETEVLGENLPRRQKNYSDVKTYYKYV